MSTNKLAYFLLLIWTFISSGCFPIPPQPGYSEPPTNSPTITLKPTSTPTPSPTTTETPTPTITYTPTPTFTPTNTLTPTPTEIGGGTGKLFFHKFIEVGEIYSVNIDGTNLTQIVENAGEFAFSPTGDSIAYENHEGIWLINPDGSDQRQLISRPSTFHYGVEWFPDGNSLFINSYWSKPYREIPFYLNLEGTVLSPINITDGENYQLSPDGNKIAFDLPQDKGRNIHIINVDGTNQTQITVGLRKNFYPIWSPDSSKIIYLAYTLSGPNIGLVNIDGSNEMILVENAEPYRAIWLNDSSILFFDTYPYGPGFRISRINIDGTGEMDLITDGIFRWAMGLSPDRQKIAFAGNCTSPRACDILVMNIDGTDLQKITESPGDYKFITWQP